MTLRSFTRPRHRALLRPIVITLNILILFQFTAQSIVADIPPTHLINGGQRGDAVASVEQASASASDLSAFHLLTVDEGWVLLDQQLYWTRDGGQTWALISPFPFAKEGQREDSSVRSAFFLDTGRGWLIANDALGNYTIAHTADTGATWQTRKLSLFSPDDPDAHIAAVHLYFLDAQTGWLVTRRATNSAFDVGALFKTIDGGDTWTRLTIPIGDQVYFATADLGWVAGGPAHTQLFAARDGGQSWQSVTFPFPKGREKGNGFYPLLPKFDNARNGTLPVIIAAGNEARLDFYRTRDGGLSWEPGSQLSLGKEIAPGTRYPLSILNTGQSIAILPESHSVATSSLNGVISITPSRDPFLSGIRELDMATPRVGWAKHIEGSCVNGETLAPHASPEGSVKSAGETRCMQTARLLRTTDGGQSWQPLNLPISSASILPSTSAPRSVTSPTSFTATVTGQGFDACGLPSLSQFHTWWVNSPYMAYNLYIGGSALAACDPLTASFVSQLAAQGWKFFPTWVGPQAPCAGFASSISYDTTTAYNQGIAQADLALDAMYNLGLTDATKSGAVIYYDLEAYNTSNSACRAAANSFISGWTGRLQTRGNVAGAYGASCASAISDWANLSNVPDIVWIAHWIYSGYNSNATVWNAVCLDNTLWVNHQRLRQYAGGHNETWGGVTLNIDSDVLDGVVASLSNIVKNHYYFPFIAR